jgi:ABC-type glycerol-3-phosphate transport system permease component
VNETVRSKLSVLKKIARSFFIRYTVFNLPFSIWILKVFIEDLPGEIEEAAKVDGAMPFQIFRLIVVPLAAPPFSQSCPH